MKKSEQKIDKLKKQIWVITIGGYGSFMFEGDETEAEEMRKHKAYLEQGVGRKRLADEDELQTNVINKCKNHKNYKTKDRYYCKCGKCIKRTWY